MDIVGKQGKGWLKTLGVVSSEVCMTYVSWDREVKNQYNKKYQQIHHHLIHQGELFY